MHVWVADFLQASDRPHFHPTPRFVYVLEGAVVLELDGSHADYTAVGVCGDAWERTTSEREHDEPARR